MSTQETASQVNHEDIVRLAGDLGELKIARILEIGATVGDLEEACALVSGDGEAIGGVQVEPTGVVAEIYDILKIEEVEERGPNVSG